MKDVGFVKLLADESVKVRVVFVLLDAEEQENVEKGVVLGVSIVAYQFDVAALLIEDGLENIFGEEVDDGLVFSLLEISKRGSFNVLKICLKFVDIVLIEGVALLHADVTNHRYF
jgi:hypothetical protein